MLMKAKAPILDAPPLLNRLPWLGPLPPRTHQRNTDIEHKLRGLHQGLLVLIVKIFHVRRLARVNSHYQPPQWVIRRSVLVDLTHVEVDVVVQLIATNEAVDRCVAETGKVVDIAEDEDVDKVFHLEVAVYHFTVFGGGDGELFGVEPRIDCGEEVGILFCESDMACLRLCEGAGEGTTKVGGVVTEEALVNLEGACVITSANGNENGGVVEFARSCQSLKEARVSLGLDLIGVDAIRFWTLTDLGTSLVRLRLRLISVSSLSCLASGRPCISRFRLGAVMLLLSGCTFCIWDACSIMS